MAGKTDRKNLPVRTKKAKDGGQFGQVVKRDRAGRIVKVRVPGSNMKAYEVIIRRRGAVSTECRLETPIGHEKCRGNSNGHVCFHSFAALQLTAADSGKTISFCADGRDAALLARTGGKAIRFRSHQGSGFIWGVVK